MRVIGYARVSTDEQAEVGGGIAAQRMSILAACNTRGWDLVDLLYDQAVSARRRWLQRPALAEAISRVEGGKREAEGLVIARLDRLTRSIGEFQDIMERCTVEDWHLIVLDREVDTTTASGRLTANIMVCFAEFERALISERTKDALAAKAQEGVALGRPPAITPELTDEICEMYSRGIGARRIAALLEKRGIPTIGGGPSWWPSTVQRIINRQKRRQGATLG